MNVIVKQIRDKGKIVYEYNPLFNYRVNYELQDLITPDFKFSLKYPVDIQCQTSYDGSVNLILNDGLNKSKLINSRFRVNENNTYEVINRSGNNDANLYDKEQFDTDTSLVKSVKKIPSIQFYGIDGSGQLPCGSYNFYFKYEDDDGNETDFIGETGSIVCHIGLINNPTSIRSGLENENSGKAVNITIDDIDESYNNLRVYYSRRTSSAHHESIVEYKKIINKYTHQNGQFNLRIDGNEATVPSTLQEINKEYFRFTSAKTQVQCGNRLFLGNLTKDSIDHKEFKDVSLRILPYYEKADSKQVVGGLNHQYVSTGNGQVYYDSKNIHDNVGYWNEEIYRLGIVYILNDDSLSPVFNIRGKDNLPSKDNYSAAYTKFDLYDSEGNRTYVNYDNYTSLISLNDLENSKGVVRINDQINDDKIYNLGVIIPDDVLNYMKSKLHIKGYFIVRQKRIATILTQAFVIGHEPFSGIPVLKIGNDYVVESFVSDDGTLVQSYDRRLVKLSECDNQAAICPDYQIRQELYNNFFTNADFVIREVQSYELKEDQYTNRAYYAKKTSEALAHELKTVSIIGVPDSTVIKRTKDNLFRAKAGLAESYDFETVGGDFDIDFGKSTKNIGNVVRGCFGSFLGLSGYNGECNKLINIYIPDYSTYRMTEYFKQRYLDTTPYYAITDRIPIHIDSSNIKIFRGDCYICQYTHRIHRNFQDPNAPTNETIVDNLTFTNYKPKSNPTDLTNINIGDLNAINIGSWLTFTVRSSNNISMRDYDGSRVEESLLMGNNRSFYPLAPMSADGGYKLPDSTVFNNGISQQLSEKAYFEQPDVPYLKTNYQNRICYSDVSVMDAFKNGYRSFQDTNYQDYSNEFGGIMKLVEWQNSIVVIFEHGIGILPINERVMAGSGMGGDVYLNTNRVLPQQINMITTDYGTQWPDSVIKTEFGIYGVDTVAKKIWKFANNTVTIISERKIQKFLNENITFSERTLSPMIGICNLKTHYNKFKRDIMFTFYNQLEGIEEVSWNICFNEYTQKFTTFYSWIPSFSENIDNIYFSYDRDSSKKLAFFEYNKEGSIILQQFVDPAYKRDKPFTIKAPEGSLVVISGLKNDQYIYYTNQEEQWDTKNDDDTNRALKNGVVKSENGTVTIPISAEGLIYLKGDLTRKANKATDTNYPKINVVNSDNIPIKFTIEGNIRTLVDTFKTTQWDDTYKDKIVYSLEGLFQDSLVEDASNLLFPDIIIYEKAYKNLFKDCTELKFGPTHLPANVLFDSAYEGMFSGCTSLLLGPCELPAEFVGTDSYKNMFLNCANLAQVIKLQAAVDPAYAVPVYKTCKDYSNNWATIVVDKPNDSKTNEDGSIHPFISVANGNIIKEALNKFEDPSNNLPDIRDLRLFMRMGDINTGGGEEEREPSNLTDALLLEFNVPILIKQKGNEETDTQQIMADAYTNMFQGCTSLKYINLLSINGTPSLKDITTDSEFKGIFWMQDQALYNYFEKAKLENRIESQGFDNFNYYLSVNVDLPRHSEIQWSFDERQYFNTDKVLAIHNNQLYITDLDAVKKLLEQYKYVPININATILYKNAVYNIYKKTFYLSNLSKLSEITTDFWKHGQGGIIDIKDTIKPSTWYGKVHPFEFEYVVREDLDKQKTFDSLHIISNNVAPESFHYEIIGDDYDFSPDKLNMYVRQELTKELYQKNGSDITYNRNYKQLLPEVKQRDTYTLNRLDWDVNNWKQVSQHKDKSTLFPQYYKRTDTINEIYDSYARATSPNKNYSQLSGTEITYDQGLSQFNLVNHVEAIDMKDPIQGRLRGNMQYLEGKWYVQINPINFVQKNESSWSSYEIEESIQYKIPLNVCYLQLHNDIKEISIDKLPSLSSTAKYLYNDIDTSSWGSRKEIKLKDKYMKVKIRYNTNKLTLIVGVNTLYRI